MTSLRTIAALCVAANTPYRTMPGVECYDKRRDARSFNGGMPIICHPPCRAWSAFLRHQAKPDPGESELGLFCAERLRECGGVLEHPAYSRLFDAAKLPRPLERSSDLWTIAVWQSWWGYPMRKGTWLCFSRVDPARVEVPYRMLNDRGADRIIFKGMSRTQRAQTTPAFADWLVNLARSVE